MAKKLEQSESVEETKSVEETIVSESEQVTADMKVLEGDGVRVRRPQPGSVAARQLHYFAEQAKVRYRLPKAPGDKSSFETSCVNDLLITVMKGQTVSLPEDIAKMFDDSQNITDNALSNHALKDLPNELQ